MPRKKLPKYPKDTKKDPLRVGDDEEKLNPVPDEGEELVSPNSSTGVAKGKEATKKNEANSVDAIKEELERNLKFAVTAVAELNAEMEEDILFDRGQQWTSEEKATLQAQNRPCIVFNKIKPMVLLVAGHFIQNSARIEVTPEGGEDQTFSAISDALVKHIDKIAALEYKLGYLFTGGIRQGKACLEAYMDFNEDPIFGQLQFPYHGPFRIYWDPSGQEYDKSDCDYAFKVIRLSRSKLKNLFPDKSADIDQLSDDNLDITQFKSVGFTTSGSDYGNDPRADKSALTTPDSDTELEGDQKEFTLVEYWKRVNEKKKFLYFPEDGAVVEVDTDEEVQAELQKRKDFKLAQRQAELDQMYEVKLQAAQKGDAIMQDSANQLGEQLQSSLTQQIQREQVNPDEIKVEHVVRDRNVKRMKVFIQAGNLELTSGFMDSPFEPDYHDFTFFEFICEYTPEAKNFAQKIQGIVRSMKDPQREVNKARSQFLHILNTSANSGWIGDEDALDDTKWGELEQFGSTPGITIRKKKGSDLQRIQPVAPDLANQIREKSSTDGLKEVSGINADLLSVDSSANPSGKAIALRIRQAVTILAIAFRNFSCTKKKIGNFLFRIIPTMFDAAKIEKILGQKFMQENQLDRGKIKAYLTMIGDGRYNVSISERGAEETLRSETFEDLMTMLEKGMQLPPDVLFEFMNIPNKQELLNKIEEFQKQQAAAIQAAAAAKSGKSTPQLPQSTAAAAVQ